MSDAMLILLETPHETVVSRLPESRNIESWHQAMVAEIIAGLGLVHARLFAAPAVGQTGIVWTAPGREMRRFVELPVEDRRAVTAVVGSLLSDIRRLTESGRAPATAAAWPMLREIPAENSIFVVDGRPVLAGWGHVGKDGRSGLLARSDDGIRFHRQPPWPWRSLLATLATLACFALAAGLLLPFLAPWLIGDPAQCMVAPGQLGLLDQQNQEMDRGNVLRGILADLNEQQARRRLQCAMKNVPNSQQSTHADLPENRWKQRDLSLFEGCWHKYTNMTVRETSTQRILPVKEWTLCFDRNGRGRQTIVLTNGARCDGPIQATFGGADELEITEPARCTGDRNKLRSESTCRRESDDEAVCTSRELEGVGAGQVAHQNDRFRR